MKLPERVASFVERVSFQRPPRTFILLVISMEIFKILTVFNSLYVHVIANLISLKPNSKPFQTQYKPQSKPFGKGID